MLFANNTSISHLGDNLQLLLNEISSEMGKLEVWFDKNKLSLNWSKIKIILFGNCRINTQINIQIDGITIERVTENKFLGITIDEKLEITYKIYMYM